MPETALEVWGESIALMVRKIKFTSSELKAVYLGKGGTNDGQIDAEAYTGMSAN